MKKRNERTSLRIGRIAARVLASRKYREEHFCLHCGASLGSPDSADIRALAASCLTQLPDRVRKKLGVK